MLHYNTIIRSIRYLFIVTNLVLTIYIVISMVVSIRSSLQRVCVTTFLVIPTILHIMFSMIATILDIAMMHLTTIVFSPGMIIISSMNIFKYIVI